MKRLLRISSLIVLYCLTTAKSCDSPGEEKARDQANIIATRDSITSVVSSESLSEETLKAFEESAKQKLSDFSDYASVMTDTTIGQTFRNQAADMIRQLFIADALVMPEKSAENLVFDSVTVLQPLHRTSANSYAGQLSCIVSTAKKYSTYGKSQSTRVLAVDIHLIKRAAVIGKDTLSSWKIFLGKFH
ncbi:MAG: hypothetical protein WCK09_03845 [Bacteroidota bacterium]